MDGNSIGINAFFALNYALLDMAFKHGSRPPYAGRRAVAAPRKEDCLKYGGLMQK
jgi:hypothetical protein